MVEEKKCVKWDEDQDDETKVTKIVTAPNGRSYRIRALSSIENVRIADATTKYSSKPGRGRKMEMDFRMDNARSHAMILQKGVVDPDFSKKSLEAIEEWMGKKTATVNFLLDEIAIFSGFRETTPSL